VAALICPSCRREANADDGPMCLDCVRGFVPRPPPIATAGSDPIVDPPEGRAGPGAERLTGKPDSASEPVVCADPDCPHSGLVTEARCLACGRSSRRLRQSIRFPWGAVDIPAKGKLRIGREDSPLAAELSGFSNVGRRHAVVESIGNNVVVTDLKSSNGTFVNGERITPLEPRIVGDGDRVRFAASVETVIELGRVQ
jgi:hypothetical protein